MCPPIRAAARRIRALPRSPTLIGVPGPDPSPPERHGHRLPFVHVPAQRDPIKGRGDRDVSRGEARLLRAVEPPFGRSGGADLPMETIDVPLTVEGRSSDAE